MTDREMIVFLWDLLDDIDTASDRFKTNYEALAEYVYKKQQRRHETGITSDGYKLYHPDGSVLDG